MLALVHLFVFRLVLFLSVDFRLHIKDEHPVRSNNYLVTANNERLIIMLVTPIALSLLQKFSNLIQSNQIRIRQPRLKHHFARLISEV